MPRINYARLVSTAVGYYARLQIFPVRAQQTKRGIKRFPTTAIQERVNLRNSERMLSDLIHLNFTPKDDNITLTYQDGFQPESYDDAMRILRNFIRRYKPVWAEITGREKSEFKYIVVTEQGKDGRFHHHCIFSGGVGIRDIIKVWKRGKITECTPLQFDANGVRGLSHYITKQRLGYQRYSRSRNLKKPAPRSSDYKFTYKELNYINEHPEDVGFIEDRFPGWKVSPRGVFTSFIRDELKEADGEEVSSPSMPFVEINLYREDCPYFRYDRFGNIEYILDGDFDVEGREIAI